MRAEYFLVQGPFRYTLFPHFLLPFNSIKQFFVLVSWFSFPRNILGLMD